MTSPADPHPAPIIAIDGPSGAGKSTVARRLAEELDLPHLDSGALYRAVALAALRAHVDLEDAEACTRIAAAADIRRRDGRTYLDGEDVEEEIRGDRVTAAVSTVAAHPGVREELIPIQRVTAARHGAVAEGRDMGTVVFPDADLKVFLTASDQERARRRAEQVGAQDLDEIAQEIARRDAADAGREVAPLVRADDAWEVDTTDLPIDEVVSSLANLARTVWARAGRDDLVPDDEDGQTAGREEGSTGDEGAPELSDERVEQETAALRRIEAARRDLPRVVVVGRPNVGKSTLVNRILGRREAIVEERPGVTRDRTEHLASWLDRHFLVVDTGGWEHGADGMAARVVEQAERAVAEADLVLFVVDATVGALADDDRYAKLLRRAEIPVLLVANKVDSQNQRPMIHELYGLGLGDPHPVSALHGKGVGDLLDEVLDELGEGATHAPDEDQIPRVAVVGRPNVGKSSLFNALVGEDRSIVDAVPHTTRDAVDTPVIIDDEPWIFVDTAGLRRRYRHGEETEIYSVDRTRRAVERADLALFVIDGSEQLGEQDQRLAAMVRDAGCGVILVVNKWDLVDEDRRPYLERELDRLLGFTNWAPRVNVSALTRRGLGRIVPWLQQVWDDYRIRIPTSELNAWLQEVTSQHAPPSGRGNRPIRARYATQAESAPPVIVVFASGDLEEPYKRYLERELRDRYGFLGTPVVIRDRRT